MAWTYSDRRQRRPLDTPVRPAGGGGTGGPPTGPAGGDLMGTYPDPQIGPGAVGDAEITSVAYSKVTGAPAIPTTLPPSGPASGDLTGMYPAPTIAAGAVGNAEISDVAYAKVTGAPTIPTSLPPTGPAGGDLAGTYPNPTVNPTASVTTRRPVLTVSTATTLTESMEVIIATAAVVLTLPLAASCPGRTYEIIGQGAQPTLTRSGSDLIFSALAAGQTTTSVPAGARATFLSDGGTRWYLLSSDPANPGGVASGALTGAYPGPTLANGAVALSTQLFDNVIRTTKLFGFTPVAGDAGKLIQLDPTNPTTTFKLAAVTVNATGQMTVLADPTAPLGVATKQYVDARVGTGGPPTGAASGSLAGTYPGPSIAASAVRGTPSSGGTAREIAKASIWGGDDLVDLSVPTAKLAAGSTMPTRNQLYDTTVTTISTSWTFVGQITLTCDATRPLLHLLRLFFDIAFLTGGTGGTDLSIATYTGGTPSTQDGTLVANEQLVTLTGVTAGQVECHWYPYFGYFVPAGTTSFLWKVFMINGNTTAFTLRKRILNMMVFQLA